MSVPNRFADTMTVNAVLQQCPASVEVFNALGIDACCGGAASLNAAARDAHVALDTLIAALDAVANTPAPTAGSGAIR